MRVEELKFHYENIYQYSLLLKCFSTPSWLRQSFLILIKTGDFLPKGWGGGVKDQREVVRLDH
jgi:hypothetical protein